MAGCDSRRTTERSLAENSIEERRRFFGCERSATDDARHVLLSILSGEGSGACRFGRRVFKIAWAVADDGAVGIDDVGGIAGADAVRFTRVERTSEF